LESGKLGSWSQSNKDYFLYFTSDVKNQRRGANG
jgi:hypothetical protein